MSSSRDLLLRLEQAFANPDAADLASLQQVLQNAKPDFINLLRYQGPNAESRSQVQSRAPMTPAGQVVLDEEPDVREVLLLSDELKLDEILSLLCILTVRDELGEVSAAAAAGLYFEERRALLCSLWMLLQAQVLGAEGMAPGLLQLVSAYNEELLSLERQGHIMLVERLVELIRDSQLEAGPGSRLPVVVDTHGREVDRNVLVQREQALLCECLVYACCIRRRLTSTDISGLVDLTHHLALKVKAAGPGALSLQQQGYVVLLATLLTLAPLQDAGEPGDAETDAQALDALARCTALDGKVCGLDPAAPHCAALKLAWGVLLAQHGPESSLERAGEQVNAALGAGVFGFLRTDVVESVPMQDDADHQRELHATILNQMLMAFLDSPVGRDAVESLTAASASLGQQEVAATAAASTPASQAAAGALVLADTSSAGASSAAGAGAKPDNLASLLSLLAGVLALYPDLFLDESQRHAVLGAFMGHLAGQQALVQAPSVFVAYMDVLTALAAGEKGARSMYQQLRPDNSVEVLTWRRMFSVLVQYIRLYNPPDQLEGAGAGNAAGAGGTGGVPQRTADFVLPACDSLALCAYLRLFSRVMSEGQADEVASWVSQLEEDAGVAPIWEVLVQLMCCPVPQELKAALDEALASVARRPDLSSLLLERLVAAVVVQPGGGAGQAAVPRYDLTYQLNEIEARSEEYVEAVAFVRLLNALWRGLGEALPNEGRGLAHLTKFVKDDVLATVFQRTYKEERQCWELGAACLEHCRLCIEGFNPSGAGDTNGTAKPPGYEVLTDILGERAVLRACMRILLAPVEQLAAERNGAPYGAAKEAAALAALRLLCAVLEVDAEFVAAVRRATLTATYEPLDGVLRHDRSRIPALLDYVRYPHNPALQLTALRLAAHLAERLPDLVHLLPDDVRLVGGFAACLQDALFNTDSTWAEEEGGGTLAAARSGDEGGVSDSEDPRATLILTLLLGALDQPAPNLTHLLAGFNYDAGMNLVGPGPSQYNVLRVVLEALGSPTLPSQHPHLYEQCLELVHDLAAAPDTGPAMLDTLRSRWPGFAVLLDTLALAPLPEAAAARAASLNSRAWLLKLLALELHHADLALAHHAQVAQGLLEALFAPPEAGDPGSSSGQSRMQQLLQLVTSFGPLDKPQLGRDAPPEVRRMLQSLDADSLFAGEAGTSVISPRGYVLYDVRAVKNSLLQRYNDWVSRHGPPNDALKEACRLCLAFAQESNTFVDEVAGQTTLTASWCAVTTIAFSRRLEALVSACGGASPTELCLGGAEDCLGAASQLVADGKDTLAAPICDVLGVLLACLQERLGAAAAPRPLVETIPPPRCLELLDALLATAWEGRRSEAVRLPLYTSLGTYLALTCQAEAPAGPPAVLESLLKQGDSRQPGTSGSSAAQLDELQSQLEEGVAGLLQAHSRVLGLLAADAQGPNMAQAAVALTTLVAMVGSDTSGALAQEIHALGLPTLILQGLANTPASLLSERSPGVGARLQVVQLQLALLNRLCLAGPTPTDGPQKLFLAQALVRLSGFQLLDAQPEDPYTYNATGMVSQRRRLGGILVAALRLALGVLRPLSHSGAVREQALGLVDAHARTWVRLLHDASHVGNRDWSPGAQEVEQAELALQLLAEVLPDAADLAAWPQLHEAFSRLAARYLWPAPNSQLFLPGPVGLDGAGSGMEEEGPAAAAADLQARARVLGLRCALALCVYRGGLTASLFPYAADPSTAHPLVFLRNALALVVHQDMPFLLDLGTGLVPFNSREAGGQNGMGPDMDVLQEVLLYRTSHLAELLVSTYFELLRAQPQNEGQLPELQGKRREEVRGIFAALEQLLQRGSLLVKYADTLPLLLRRTVGLLQ